MQKTMIIFGLLLSLFLAAGSALAQDVDKLEYPDLSKMEIPEVEKITLDNGIRLYLLPDNSLPVFRGSARINCGSYLEPADKIGLASVCGTVMRTGGTSKWTGDEIDEELEAIGGSVETSIGLASGNARVNVLSEYTDLGLEVLAEVLRRPVFDEDKIDLAKVQEKSAISRRNDEPMQIAIREYRKVIYGADSPYARHTEHATINAIERQDLVDFHATYCHPQNVQLAFWGDFDRDALLEKVNMYFGDWEQGGEPVPPVPDVDYQFDRHVFYINKADVNQANILMGHIGGLVTDEDYPARIVMNNILGGSFGSRMFNAVRSREGLAYATFAVYTANISYPGVFYAFASTKSETTAKAVREVIKVVDNMQTEPPTKDEMRMGKDGYLNSFVFNFDSKSEVVNRLMSYDFYGLPDDFLFQEKEKVEQVGAADVIQAAKDNLRPDALRILVVGKGEDFEMPLDQLALGDVTEIDITISTGEEKKELTINEETLAKGMDILEQAVEAHGGLAAFENINSVDMKATVTISNPGMGEMSLQQESIRVYPGKSRSVVNFMGMQILSIRDDLKGWKTDMATQKIVPMTEEEILESDNELARSTIRIFRSIDDPYYQAVYDGSGTVDGKTVDYVVLLDDQKETICRLGFDRETNMLVTKSYWGELPTGQGTIVEHLSEYKEISGVKLPMASASEMDDQKVMGVAITEYNINSDVPADAFAQPQ